MDLKSHIYYRFSSIGMSYDTRPSFNLIDKDQIPKVVAFGWVKNLTCGVQVRKEALVESSQKWWIQTQAHWKRDKTTNKTTKCHRAKCKVSDTLNYLVSTLVSTRYHYPIIS